ncbi:mechanosensitive ion channel family protein [Nocardioides sp.]|uniref:mechanosensitive ion channel family protein n=1 Tax=Nocardioides sp. TaxID=35761 RepID=UPI003529189B
MTWEEVGHFVVGWPLTVILLMMLGLVARFLLYRAVDRLVRRAEEGVLPDRLTQLSTDPTRRVQRARTMGSLFKSIISAVIVAVVGTMILSEFVDIGPILASAGIAGVALGFGAQSLVKDFLSGIFMIFEDQYGVGDVVDAGEATGTVEAVGLRVTRLRDVDGTVWYVRNGEIIRIGNKSQNWARSVLDIGVAYGEDLSRVRRILEEVAHTLWEDDEFQGVIIEEPEVWGVEDLAADAVTVRVTLKTAPLEQWRVARVMRERIKARFDHEGIEIPFPQRVVWQRSETDDTDAEAGHDKAGDDKADDTEAAATGAAGDG